MTNQNRKQLHYNLLVHSHMHARQCIICVMWMGDVCVCVHRTNSCDRCDKTIQIKIGNETAKRRRSGKCKQRQHAQFRCRQIVVVECSSDCVDVVIVVAVATVVSTIFIVIVVSVSFPLHFSVSLCFSVHLTHTRASVDRESRNCAVFFIASFQHQHSNCSAQTEIQAKTRIKIETCVLGSVACVRLCLNSTHQMNSTCQCFFFSSSFTLPSPKSNFEISKSWEKNARESRIHDGTRFGVVSLFKTKCRKCENLSQCNRKHNFKKNSLRNPNTCSHSSTVSSSRLCRRKLN